MKRRHVYRVSMDNNGYNPDEKPTEKDTNNGGKYTTISDDNTKPLSNGSPVAGKKTDNDKDKKTDASTDVKEEPAVLTVSSANGTLANSKPEKPLQLDANALKGILTFIIN